MLNKNQLIALEPDRTKLKNPTLVPELRSFKPGAKIYAEPSVAKAISAVYGGGMISESENAIIRYTETFLRKANAYSKAVKVIFNPPSYAINYLGAQFSMFGMGIMPMVNPTYYKNLGRGFTQSQTLDKVMDFITKPSADKKAKIISELLELQKIGVLDSDRAASIFADDIIQAVQKGKIPYIDSSLEFFGKAYSAFCIKSKTKSACRGNN